MERTKFSRAYAEAQTAAGKCVRCGDNLPKPTRTQPVHTLCNKCLQKKAARTKAVYYERKANGLCVKCGKPAVPGKVKCTECAKKHW